MAVLGGGRGAALAGATCALAAAASQVHVSDVCAALWHVSDTYIIFPALH